MLTAIYFKGKETLWTHYCSLDAGCCSQEAEMSVLRLVSEVCHCYRLIADYFQTPDTMEAWEDRNKKKFASQN